MKSAITVVAHADNRPTGSQKEGSAAPLVQILILEYGDINSIAFHPSLAASIAAAISKAGKDAIAGKDYEARFVIVDEDC